MNEHERIDYIKKETDATPIPESLEPEHIRERLSTGTSTTDTATIKTTGATASAADRKTSRPWYRNPWIYTAACLVLCLTGVIGYHSLMPSTSSDSAVAHIDNESAKLSDSSANSADAVQDYQNLFRLLQKNSQGYNQISDIAEIAEDEESIASVSDSASSVRSNTDYYDTNSQVADVSEADIVKTDGTYIYSCYSQESHTLNAVAITHADRGDLTACGTISSDAISDAIHTDSFRIEELYLADHRLVLLCSAEKKSTSASSGNDSDAASNTIICYGRNPNATTYILTYDVTDAKHPELLSALMQEGSYSDSRMTDGYLYTFTDKWALIPEGAAYSMDYFPHVNDSVIDYDDICLPSSDSSCFQIMTGLSIEQPDTFDASKAILSDQGTYYVSPDYIYFAQPIYSSLETDNFTETELLRFSYANGQIEAKGQTTFHGRLLNQFSMDEYNGYLRVVATIEQGWDSLSNALYIFNDNLEITGSIQDLAPNETIYSVRFMGDTGYFVTYRNTDPLFAVNLSDPEHPEVTDALKIPGFSNYLHAYSDHLLFGLGEETNPDTGEFLGLKLSMFDTSDPYHVTEAAKTVLPALFFSTAQYDHKSLLIDPEKNLIGFYAEYYNSETYDYNEIYTIYSYEPDTGFREVFRCNITQDPVLSHTYEMDSYNIRGLYIGNVLYLVNGNRICSYSLDTYQKLKELIIADDGASTIRNNQSE